jgi:universal stress protein E
VESLKNLLVVVDESHQLSGANRYLFEKTVQLARASDAAVHVVQVIYEGVAEIGIGTIEASVELKNFILQAAEAALEDLTEDLAHQLPKMETAVIWNSRQWEGVLHAAERADADLIVKAASVRQGGVDMVRTPDDWNLLRQADVPVLLVKEQAWVNEPVILAALDAIDDRHEDLNGRILKEGAAMARLLDGSLQIVVTYPMFEHWVGEMGQIGSYEEMTVSIEKEIREVVNRCADRAGVDFAMLHAEEGKPAYTIARVADMVGAEILCLGSHSRRGLKGALIGNTSEKILHRVDVDVLTLH